jgi:hypothetical protein
VTPVKAGKIFHIVLILFFNGLPYTPLSTIFWLYRVIENQQPSKKNDWIAVDSLL